MKVIALYQGFYGGKPIDPGTEFEVPDGSKARWYAPVGNEPKAVAKAKPKKDEPQALSQLGKEPAKSFIDAHAEKADLA